MTCHDVVNLIQRGGTGKMYKHSGDLFVFYNVSVILSKVSDDDEGSMSLLEEILSCKFIHIDYFGEKNM